MHVPPGQSQQEHRKYLECLITWHPHGQDSSTPLSPKPPLTMKTLRMLALIRVVDELISPTKSTCATINPPSLLPLAAAQASEQSAAEFLGTHGISRAAGGNFPDKQSRERDRWMRLKKMTIIPIAVAAVAGFVGGYNSRAPNHPVEVAVARSPEIRRGIPVEPEIRKAIPVQTRKPQVDRRSDSMAFIRPRMAIPRGSATRRDRQPARRKPSSRP
jgi:hypothetical protein